LFGCGFVKQLQYDRVLARRSLDRRPVLWPVDCRHLIPPGIFRLCHLRAVNVLRRLQDLPSRLQDSRNADLWTDQFRYRRFKFDRAKGRFQDHHCVYR